MEKNILILCRQFLFNEYYFRHIQNEKFNLIYLDTQVDSERIYQVHNLKQLEAHSFPQEELP